MEVTFFQSICNISLLLIMVAIVVCFIRMILGPTLPDRILALDITANLLISFIAVYSMYKQELVYIDVILALALIVFLTTVAFANLMGWQAYREKLAKKKGIEI
jgi:multicomponent Na+:H+ antiporter subunit F